MIEGLQNILSDKIKCFTLLGLSTYVYMYHTMQDYCTYLGFCSPQIAMPISVISPAGYLKKEITANLDLEVKMTMKP